MSTTSEWRWLGNHYQDADLILANETGGLLDRQNIVNRYFKPLLTKGQAAGQAVMPSRSPSSSGVPSIAQVAYGQSHAIMRGSAR